MVKKRSYAPLGEAEMEMLQHVWALEGATVIQVHERVLQDREVAYTTVMTILKKLADKGYLRYEKEGKSYVYYPKRPPEQVRKNVLNDIIGKVFQGSPVALVQTLVKQGVLSEEERKEIVALIEKLGRTDLKDALEE